MKLGWFLKRRLHREGYVQVRAVVPPARIEAALGAINRSLGQQGLPPERLSEMRARTFCPEIISRPEIVDLFEGTPAKAIAESVLGAGRVRPPLDGQIALRFPQAVAATAPAAPSPHIDGMYTPENGVPAGTIYHFTALLGVFLNDVESPHAGNFTVWPGTHDRLEEHFRRHGPESLLRGFPAIALPEPRPLLGRAGDIVLSHYALAHAAGPNIGPHIRYAVFFRLFHVEHEAFGMRSLTDLWLEWEGMREFRQERAGVVQGDGGV